MPQAKAKARLQEFCYDPPPMILDLFIVLALIALNGFFALAEMAVVTSRRARLKQLAEESTGARIALTLAEDPGRFLSTIQVAITLIGVLAGAFGGAELSGPVGAAISDATGIAATTAQQIAFGLVVVVISSLSVVLGELVPKRLALAAPERLAALTARPLLAAARVMAPAAWLLERASSGVLFLLGASGTRASLVTEEEIRSLVEEGAESGAINETERDLVHRVFRFGDKFVDDLMTPRPQMVTLEASAPAAENLEVMRETGYSRYPVTDDRGEVIGIVRAKDLVAHHAAQGSFDVGKAMRTPFFVPETTRAIDLLQQMRASDRHMVLVIDEYGATQGLVTLTDVLEAIVGEIEPSSTPPEEKTIVRREDGSLLIDGLIPIDDLKEALNLRTLPGEEDMGYNTLAGFFLAQVERIPSAGDHFTWNGWRFEVMDMDGRRIDKVLVSAATTETEGSDSR